MPEDSKEKGEVRWVKFLWHTRRGYCEGSKENFIVEMGTNTGRDKYEYV